MAIWLATHTKAAIDSAVSRDGGNEYRRWLGMVMPHIGDAYRSDEDGRRSHLGASVLGVECDKAAVLSWRWASDNSRARGKKGEDPVAADSRMRRLWNRGHMEEGRFIAMLLAAGIAVYQQGADGKQYRITNYGGHFSGSGDGILMGVPDLPQGVPCLGEFKTHSDDSFESLVEKGVQLGKPQHYVQMQQYMFHMGLLYCLYLAVNKNNDMLHAEIVQYDHANAAHFIERAGKIIFADRLPPRIRGASPGFFMCKYMCDHLMPCYNPAKVMRSCRTCQHVKVMPDGYWACTLTGEVRDKAAQLAGCNQYQLGKMFK
jgi:hypothetical protein